jgi:hypothetical protein
MSSKITMPKLRVILSLCCLLSAPLLPGKAAGENAWTTGSDPLLVINLLNFDAGTGDLQARLMLKLPKSDINPRFSPLHNYFLVDELTVNESVLKIDSAKPYSAFDNAMPTTYQVDDAGSQFKYPFDVHRAELRIFADRTKGTNDDEMLPEHLKLQLDTSLCSFEGYKVTLIPGPDHGPNYVDYMVELRRTLPIRLFTTFVSVLMLLVSLGFLNMVLKLVRSHSAPDINEMAFGAALLFAFPAIRSIEPFVPPMGVLSDFFGFFWAETIVAIALIIHLNCWMKRKHHD